MGTRGVYGFRKNGVDKITYNHFDSYPSHLGEKVLQFCKETSIEEMNRIYESIIMVKGYEKVTEEQLEMIPVSLEEITREVGIEFYDCLRLYQGDISVYKDGLRFMTDSEDFIKDSLFCEYGYIINLDTNLLEFWVGFQEKPYKINRYGYDKTKQGYYPCKLVKTFDLDKLENVKFPKE